MHLSFDEAHIHCTHILCPTNNIQIHQIYECPVNPQRARITSARELYISAQDHCISVKDAYKKRVTQKRKKMETSKQKLLVRQFVWTQ